MHFELTEYHDGFKQWAADVWTIDSDWKETPFRRRMTVLKLLSGGLMLHSPLLLSSESLQELNSFGRVEWIVAPNRFHCSEAAHYKAIYPLARLLTSRSAKKELQKIGAQNQAHVKKIDSSTPDFQIDGTLPEAWPPFLTSELECHLFKGTRLLEENVFFHRRSKTLVLTDLVFNLHLDLEGIERFFFKLNRIDRRFGPSRVFQYFFLKNKRLASKSLQEILEWDFDRVIMSHGDVVDTGGKELVKKSFREIGLGSL